MNGVKAAREMAGRPYVSGLLELLAGYRPAHPAEERSLERILDLLAGVDQPFSRDTYAPGHITASAFLVDRSGRGTVLLHHVKLGIWVQPGGHLEPGDAGPAEGALREAAEETGLAGLELAADAPRPFDLDVHDIPARGSEPAHAHHDLRYLVMGDMRVPVSAPDGEAPRVRWFSWDEAFELPLDSNLRLGLEKARLYVAKAR